MSRRPVLVIDEDDSIRGILVYALEVEGYEVMSAANGREGLERLRSRPPEHRPGCIILDVMMPGLDGPEFLADLRREFAHGTIPLKVVLTTSAGHHGLRELMGNDVIPLAKPMELPRLYEIVDRYCKLPHPG